MTILLTGGAGYIGSHTAVELLSSGYDVIIVDDLSNSSEFAIDRIQFISGKKVKFYKGDVKDRVLLEKIFVNNNIDSVIHFAGYKAVGESVKKPLLYYRNNLDSTLTLLEIMKKYEVNKIVFSSSATVYGNDVSIPCEETASLGGCTNPYGWTKYMIEQILKDVAYANKDMCIVLLRYFNPIGAHESGMIGENPLGIPNNLMPYVSQVAIGKLKCLGIYGNDYNTKDGTGVRDYIHVVDLAKGHVCAVKYASSNKGVEAFNIGTGIGYSVLDVVKTFQRVNNVEIKYEIKDRRKGDVAEIYANPKKANEILYWHAEKNLEDMCRDSWNWQTKNPNGYEK